MDNLQFLIRISSFIMSKLGRFYFVKSAWNFLFDNTYFLLKRIIDRSEIEIIKKEVKKGNIVLDIGAGLGFYTLFLAKIVGENGKVFAFEPEPNNFLFINKLIKRRGYKNVTLVNKAVSDTNNKLNLYLSNYHKGNHAVYRQEKDDRVIEVEAIALSDYFSGYEGNIDFVKIDANGSEETVVQGMNSIIIKARKIKILTEFWPFGLQNCGTTSQNYLNLLQQLGFAIYDIDNGKKTLADIEDLLKIYTPEKRNYTNLLCVKE